MTDSTSVREAAINSEVKLYALRKTRDGTIISFVLHPQEVPDRLMTANIGDCFVMALVGIGDDGKPKK
jgi:hypothetical protein